MIIRKMSHRDRMLVETRFPYITQRAVGTQPSHTLRTYGTLCDVIIQFFYRHFTPNGVIRSTKFALGRFADNHLKKLTYIFSDFIELFFPRICVACGNRLINQENFVCMDCQLDLPLTNFHNEDENKVAQLFWGRVNITHATSYFSYRKGSRYQQLIYAIKYRGMKELGFEIGEKFGFELKETTNFGTIDLLVPVPLHPKKQKIRGYNQSEWIAHGIANAMNLPVITNNLIRKVHTPTQTYKNRFERWKNVETIFGVEKPEVFTGKHILLIDDVVTTGSTLDACALHLLKINGVKVSIATLAFADM